MEKTRSIHSSQFPELQDTGEDRSTGLCRSICRCESSQGSVFFILSFCGHLAAIGQFNHFAQTYSLLTRLNATTLTTAIGDSSARVRWGHGSRLAASIQEESYAR
jgi:hypothetical protein